MDKYLAEMYGKQSPDFVKGFLAGMYVSEARKLIDKTQNGVFPGEEFSARMRRAVEALAEVPEDFDELIKIYS